MSRMTALRLGLAGSVLAAASVAAVLGTASSASAACFTTSELLQSGNTLYGIREAYCDPPGVTNPRPVTIQRRVNATTWTNVTVLGSGSVAYPCNGTATRTYRLKESTGTQLTAACG